MPRLSLAAKATPFPVQRIPRLRPPAGLTPAQSAIFSTLTATKPAGFFEPSDVPLLVLVSQHMTRAADIEDRIRAAENVLLLDRLARMAARESARVQSLMTRLRLTPQSRHRQDSKILKAPPLPAIDWSEE